MTHCTKVNRHNKKAHGKLIHRLGRLVPLNNEYFKQNYPIYSVMIKIVLLYSIGFNQDLTSELWSQSNIYIHNRLAMPMQRRDIVEQTIRSVP